MAEPLHLYPLSNSARLSCYGYGRHFVSRPAGAPVKIKSRQLVIVVPTIPLVLISVMPKWVLVVASLPKWQRSENRV